MWILGYGEYGLLTGSGIFWETLPFWLDRVVPALLWYIVCSILMERRHYKAVLAATLVMVWWVLPTLSVGGAGGPRHVSFATGMWAWPILIVTLITKGIILTRKMPDAVDSSKVRDKTVAEPPCTT